MALFLVVLKKGNWSAIPVDDTGTIVDGGESFILTEAQGSAVGHGGVVKSATATEPAEVIRPGKRPATPGMFKGLKPMDSAQAAAARQAAAEARAKARAEAEAAAAA